MLRIISILVLLAGLLMACSENYKHEGYICSAVGIIMALVLFKIQSRSKVQL
jgi:hypothetical protein